MIFRAGTYGRQARRCSEEYALPDFRTFGPFHDRGRVTVIVRSGHRLGALARPPTLAPARR